MKENKKNLMMPICIVAVVIVAVASATVGYYYRTLEENKQNNNNNNTGTTEQEPNKNEETNVSETTYDVYYNRYLKNLSNNLQKGLAKYNDFVYEYDVNATGGEEATFKIDKNLNLYMTYKPLNYDNYLFDTNVVKIYSALMSGPAGIPAVYYIKADGSAYSFVYTSSARDQSPKPVEEVNFPINVMMGGVEISHTWFEEYCGSDNCSDKLIKNNISSKELYSEYLKNLKNYVSGILNYDKNDEYYSVWGAPIIRNSNHSFSGPSVYIKENSFDLYLSSDGLTASLVKVDSDVLKVFLYKTTMGQTLYYIKVDGSVYRYNFDKDYADYDKEPKLLSNLKNIINVIQLSGEKRYELYEDIEGNLFYSDGKPFIN